MTAATFNTILPGAIFMVRLATSSLQKSEGLIEEERSPVRHCCISQMRLSESAHSEPYCPKSKPPQSLLSSCPCIAHRLEEAAYSSPGKCCLRPELQLRCPAVRQTLPWQGAPTKKMNACDVGCLPECWRDVSTSSALVAVLEHQRRTAEDRYTVPVQ